MLENLTFKYRYPCVLDLKMGTRQYGDDAPESKRKSQTAKAANTTTITLGVRLAGMQVFISINILYVCVVLLTMNGMYYSIYQYCIWYSRYK